MSLNCFFCLTSPNPKESLSITKDTERQHSLTFQKVEPGNVCNLGLKNH